MSDNIPLKDRVTCTNCKLPLSEEALRKKDGGALRCPRCNTLMELDPACSTSCLSCQKLQQANPSPCLEEIVSIDITNNSQEKTCEISGSNVEKNDHGSEGPVEDSEKSLLTRAWRLLKRGLFQV